MSLADAISIIAGIALLVWQMSRYHAALRERAVLAERERCAKIVKSADVCEACYHCVIGHLEDIAAKIMESEKDELDRCSIHRDRRIPGWRLRRGGVPGMGHAQGVDYLPAQNARSRSHRSIAPEAQREDLRK